jgi:hypothetical protein
VRPSTKWGDGEDKGLPQVFNGGHGGSTSLCPSGVQTLLQLRDLAGGREEVHVTPPRAPSELGLFERVTTRRAGRCVGTHSLHLVACSRMRFVGSCGCKMPAIHLGPTRAGANQPWPRTRGSHTAECTMQNDLLFVALRSARSKRRMLRLCKNQDVHLTTNASLGRTVNFITVWSSILLSFHNSLILVLAVIFITA